MLAPVSNKQRFLWLPLLFAGSMLVMALMLLNPSRSVTAIGGQALAQTDAQVVKIFYGTIAEIDKLAAYDLFEYNNLEEGYVLALATSEEIGTLANAGWRVEPAPGLTAQLHQIPALFADGYRTVDELYSELAQISNDNPYITELVDYGDSYCKAAMGCTFVDATTFMPGYDLLALRVTNEHFTSSDKPVFILMAGLHAREITPPELAMNFLNWLIDGYGVDPDATWLIDHHEIWIIPTANPDGHWLVELGEDPLFGGSPLLHRKNANNEGGCNTWPSLLTNQLGVDLNRNHSFDWGGAGTSTNPCNQFFRGTGPASEPEVAQLQAFISSLLPDWNGEDPFAGAPRNASGILITLHSHSELVLYPWNSRTDFAPNQADLQAVAEKLASFNGYTACQAPHCLYAAAGTTDDWSYAELGIASFTFEIGTSFMPTFDEIAAVQWPENGPAFIYAAKIAQAPYMQVHGPDVTAMSATVTSNLLTLQATIDDTNNGGDIIQAVRFSIDTPLIHQGVISHTMSPIDGSFDSISETVTATFSIDGLLGASHLVYIHGQDSEDNWGVMGTTFFTLEPMFYLPFSPYQGEKH